jgi:hypothetical protein
VDTRLIPGQVPVAKMPRRHQMKAEGRLARQVLISLKET